MTKEEQLLHELKSFRKQLSEHDSLTRSREAIRQFFNKDGKEVIIKLIADECASEIKVVINNKEVSSRDVRSFDLHEIVLHAIRDHGL